MTQTTKLLAADGKEVPGSLSEPASGPAPGAVLLVHEWWGLDAHIHEVADRLAQAGFTVFAVDLYEGKVAKDEATAEQYMNSMDWKQAGEVLRRGAEALRHRKPGTKVGVMGFCLGGSVALAAAAMNPDLTACVPFYGIPGEDKADVAKIRASVLGHFAKHDGWCTPERVDALEKKLKAAHVSAELHRYDAQHAFCNDKRPKVYSKPDAELAWKRTVEFLHARLG